MSHNINSSQSLRNKEKEGVVGIVVSLSSSGTSSNISNNNTKTSLKTKKYKLCDFNDVIFSGFDLTLPTETINLINTLNKKINPNTNIKVPVFNNKKDKHNQINNQKDLNWDNIHNDKIQTQSNLLCNGQVHTKLFNIQTILNKMTEVSYAELSNEIISIIKGSTKEEYYNNCKEIFKIASKNRFYSKIYADLISLLIKNFTQMKEVFDDTLKDYISLFDNIEYVNPDENYDKFCEINMNNEIRKSYSLFLVNLTKNNDYSYISLYSIIENLVEKLKLLIADKDKRNEIDEIIENLFILYDKTLLCWCIDEDPSINDYFNLLSTKFKDPNYLGLTSKSYFKICEIIA